MRRVPSLSIRESAARSAAASDTTPVRLSLSPLGDHGGPGIHPKPPLLVLSSSGSGERSPWPRSGEAAQQLETSEGRGRGGEGRRGAQPAPPPLHPSSPMCATGHSSSIPPPSPAPHLRICSLSLKGLLQLPHLPPPLPPPLSPPPPPPPPLIPPLRPPPLPSSPPSSRVSPLRSAPSGPPFSRPA